MQTQGYTPSGLTPQSFENMQLGAGAFFFDVDMDFVEPNTTADEFGDYLKQALAEGKSLGATTGGGTFSAVPETRQIEVDDLLMPIKMSTVFGAWEVTMETTIKEITKKNIERVLATVFTEDGTGALKASNTLLPEHYIPRLLWAGRLLSGQLLAIEMTDVLNTSGMTLTTTSGGEGTMAVTFRGHQADLENMQNAPFRIFFFERE